MAKHAQINQNNKFVISKDESLLQIDIMILIEMVKHFQSLQNSKFVISLYNITL